MIEINRQDIVEYARTWIDTPWQHNQCAKGCGVDCIRFAIDVYDHFGMYTGDIRNYTRQTRGNELRDYLASLPSLIKQPDEANIEPGQLLLFKVKKIPRHVGIATGEGNFIHADMSSAVKRVVEQPFRRWKHRIAAKYVGYIN